MIVFEKDWRYYPRAIIDDQTPNQSFVHICSVLKKMGVRHYYFPLALLQPELQGVNPFDEENLDEHTKAMILLEADHNPWYFIRELVIDRGAGLTLDDCRFRCNRASIAAMWLTLASIDYIRIQPRQTGKSFEADVIAIWLHYFCYHNTTMNLITNTNDTRVENIARLKKIRDGLPNYVNRNTEKDDNNQKSLSCHALHNRYISHVSQSSEKAADNLGRGLTSPYIQFDEAPFVNHIETTVSAAMGSTNTAREIARRKGEPYCTTFTTTAGDKETRDGRYIYNLWSSAAIWSEKFYDCQNRDELVECVIKNSHSPAPTVNLTLSHRQLGLSDKWLADSIARARSSKGVVIDRDYFNRWTSSSSQSPIAEKVAQRIHASECEPIHNQISKEQYIFRWYQQMDPNKKYVIGCDTSDAVGRDEIALVLASVEDGSTVGAGSYNETNLWHFAGWLFEFMIEYPNTILIIERRGNAQNIIDFLLVKLASHGYDPSKRMFSRIVQEHETRTDDYKKVSSGALLNSQQVRDQYKRYFGFTTTGDSRKLLYSDVLNLATENAADLIFDRQLIHQILSLTVRNGRIDHRQGDHDDMVIAWLLVHWFLNFGVNLNHYGIRPSDVLSKRLEKIHEHDPQEQQKLARRKHLLGEIEAVQQKLEAASSAFEIQRLEQELMTLSSKLDHKDQEVYSLDALIEQARERRKGQIKKTSSGKHQHKRLSGFFR